MQLSVASYWVPKAGLSEQEYEDASEADAERGRFAVADGASETSFARDWAQLLVRRFVEEPPSAEGLRDWLKPSQQQWNREQKKRELPWYAEQKARDGAFAALLGVSVDAEASRWSALAVGDCCLFVVRRRKVFKSFPWCHSSQFHNRPMLLSSVARSNVSVWDSVYAEEGELEPEDRVLLMTDALAAWFLVETEMKRRPWAELARAKDQDAFRAFVSLLRDGGAIRNDDVTLVSVEVP